MKYLLTSTAVACLLGISPSFAQDATSTAVGVGIAKSAAQSTAVAVSGQGGGGGSVTLTPNAIAPTAVINSNVPANQSIKTVQCFRAGFGGGWHRNLLGFNVRWRKLPRYGLYSRWDTSRSGVFRTFRCSHFMVFRSPKGGCLPALFVG